MDPNIFHPPVHGGHTQPLVKETTFSYWTFTFSYWTFPKEAACDKDMSPKLFEFISSNTLPESIDWTKCTPVVVGVVRIVQEYTFLFYNHQHVSN